MANITFNALKVVAGEGVTVGPILLGTARPAHILTPTSTVRRILNMTSFMAVDAAVQRLNKGQQGKLVGSATSAPQRLAH
jgi:phosphotransacetylase